MRTGADMRDDDVDQLSPYSDPHDLPDELEAPAPQGDQPEPSLTDDLIALFDDGKTYAEAEMAYQRRRLGFAAHRVKGAAVFGLAAFGVLHLALIALTVGLVLALIPLLGPWGATAIVTVALVAFGILMLRQVKKRIDGIRDAFEQGKRDEPS